MRACNSLRIFSTAGRCSGEMPSVSRLKAIRRVTPPWWWWRWCSVRLAATSSTSEALAAVAGGRALAEAPPQLTAADAPRSTVAIVPIFLRFKTFGCSIRAATMCRSLPRRKVSQQRLSANREYLRHSSCSSVTWMRDLKGIFMRCSCGRRCASFKSMELDHHLGRGVQLS